MSIYYFYWWSPPPLRKISPWVLFCLIGVGLLSFISIRARRLWTILKSRRIWIPWSPVTWSIWIRRISVACLPPGVVALPFAFISQNLNKKRNNPKLIRYFCKESLTSQQKYKTLRITSYASTIWRNFTSAICFSLKVPNECLSGCHCRASFLYAAFKSNQQLYQNMRRPRIQFTFTSSEVAVEAIPRIL